MCLLEVKKGSLRDMRKICEFIYFHYKCSKWQRDCSLDSWMRLTIETFKINNPAAATRAFLY